MATDDALSTERERLAVTPQAVAQTASETQPVATTTQPASEGTPDDSAQTTSGDEAPEEPPRKRTLSDSMKGFSACGVSMVVHIVLLVVLGLLVFENPIRAELKTLLAVVDPPEPEPVAIELDEEIKPVTQQTLDVLTSAPAIGAAGPAASIGTPTLDQRVVEQVEATEVMIDAPTLGIPDSVGLIESVPDGDVKGEPRDIVSDYKQAMDRLTQEIMWMLDKGPVTVIWLFDQSKSMEDDRQEIRDRFELVYDQLGILGTANSNALMTAVVSYGSGFRQHTEPTSNRELIRQGMDSVPIDSTGEELMCQAVGQAISIHRKAATRRQLALVLVTDESGQPENNGQFLEAAVAEAKSARCKIYVLGREAVFGYPYAFVRWRHPQTRRMHWLRIDRGPETGFPEQLQTNGLSRRRDAFSSGFGPFEQARLARETNGIFFMLPSIEEDLVGKEQKTSL